MRIGVDFDNTIVCYDQVFHQVAIEKGLIPSRVHPSKESVRDNLRQQGKEEQWVALQGAVYGSRMQEAVPFPGSLEFFCDCRKWGVSACIISHKTQYPVSGRQYDLHQCSREWLQNHGFLNPTLTRLSSEDVYFETTLERKLDRIRMTGCTHFVDDLADVLAHAAFPTNVTRIHFDPDQRHQHDHSFSWTSSWKEIRKVIETAIEAFV